MAVRSLVGLSPVTDSMVVTTPVDSSNYTTERLGETSTVRRAQPFIATQPYLSNVTFRKGGETGTFVGTVKVSIQAASGSNPSGIDLASRTYTNTEWLALAQNADITITLRTTVTVGSTYFIVFISSTSDNSNYSRLYFNRNVINQNTAGRPQVYNGSTWSEGSGALYFKITSGPAYYSEVARTTVTTPRTPATNRVATRDMGTALRFDGVDTTQVSIPALPALTAFTVTGWAKLSKADGSVGFFGNNLGPGANRWNTFLNQVGGLNTLQLQFRNAVSGTRSLTGLRGAPMNSPACYAITYDGATFSIYVNGTIDISVNDAFTPGITFASIGYLIGNDQWNGSPRVPAGVMNEFYVYDRALSATDIANMYFSNVIPSSPLRVYLFNETTGTTARDTSGNGNNGTITGATYTTDAPYRLRNSI